MSYQGQTIALLPGRLRGYRQWGVVDLSGNNDLALESLSAGKRWPWTPHVEARCHAASMRARFADCPPEKVPLRGCTCGLYAKHRPGSIVLPNAAVSGAIEAWGQHTEIGPEGFRARYARILGLYVSPHLPYRGMGSLAADSSHAVAQRLGEIYKVPAFDRWEDLVCAFPPVDISDLLPPPETKQPTAYRLQSATLASLVRPFPITIELGPGDWLCADRGAAKPDMTVEKAKFFTKWGGAWSWIGATSETGIGCGYGGKYLIAHEGGSMLLPETPMSLGWQSQEATMRIIFPSVYPDSHQGHPVLWAEPYPSAKDSAMDLFSTNATLPV